MYPNQNQYSIDYLNQIAPATKKPGPNKRTIAIIGGLIAVVLVVISFIVISQINAGPTEDMQRLAARLKTLQTITTDAQDNIKSSQLRSTNSSLSIILANINRNIVTPLANNNINVDKLDKTIVASEDGSKLTAKLEDARLNAVYDGTYAREMNYQLATTVALMSKIYNSTSSKSMKDFLETTNQNLQPLKAQFEAFNPTET